ncbi:MAG: hypothetical protein C4339_02210 [Nitrososphaerota archaeon]
MSEEIEAELVIGEVRTRFRGPAERLMSFLLEFAAKYVPQLQLASKLCLSYSLAELAEKFGDYVKITPEGPRVMADERLSDKAQVALQLLAQRIAKELGRAPTDALQVKEICQLTGLKEKSVSSRLSEMSLEQHVERVKEGKAVKYRLATLGIKWLEEYIRKQLKAPAPAASSVYT